MAQFLVRNVDSTSPDPEEDRRGSYKRGMVVVVAPDSHVWGAEETKAAWIAAGRDPAQWHGHFVLFRVPSVTMEQVLALTTSQVTDDSGTLLTSEDGIPLVFRRREYRLLLDNLKNSIKDELAANGEVTVSVSDVRNAIKRIRDNASYPGL